MNEPLNVVHVVLSLDFGGLERVVLNLVHHATKLGQKVAVICLERAGTLAGEVEAVGVRVVTLHKPPGLRPETTDRIREALLELRPDVVHTHQIGALFYTGPAAHSLGIPVVVHTEHTNQMTRSPALRDRLRMYVLWTLAGRHASRFFCVSEDVARAVKAFGGIRRRKVVVMTNGIDTSAFRSRDAANALRTELGIPASSPVIGSVGRLNEVKCQDRLIRAFGQVRDRFPSARLLLVGDGPMMDELRALAESLGLSGSIHFTGYQAKPERFMQVMDVFALSSRCEGMPLVILEAWAAGLPVVATRVGGIPQMIDHGHNGLIVNPDDHPALTNSLIELLDDPQRGRDMGRAARRLVEERFDTTQMAGGYDRHYRDLLTRKEVVPRCES